MKLQYFETDASDRDVIEALERDGACVLLLPDQVSYLITK